MCTINELSDYRANLLEKLGEQLKIETELYIEGKGLLDTATFHKYRRAKLAYVQAQNRYDECFSRLLNNGSFNNEE